MITVTILTKNSTKYLVEVLDALRNFNEVLIYDTGSTDHTLDIAKQYPNVTIHQGVLNGFGPTHNLASSLAKNDWILSIDSDEVVTSELNHEIQSLSLDPQCVYSFPRHNEFNGKFILWCGWYPDRQVRIYHRKNTQFTDAQVHEAIITKHVKENQLEKPLRHYSYSCVADFLIKMQSYSDLFAKQYAGKKNSSPLKAFLHGSFAFFRSYFLKKGFMGGYEGFLISAYNAHTAFYKYMKLYEINKKLNKQQ